MQVYVQSLPKVLEHLHYFCCSFSSSAPSPSKQCCCKHGQKAQKCRYDWRLVSGKYALNSTLFQGGGDFNRSTQTEILKLSNTMDELVGVPSTFGRDCRPIVC